MLGIKEKWPLSVASTKGFEMSKTTNTETVKEPEKDQLTPKEKAEAWYKHVNLAEQFLKRDIPKRTWLLREAIPHPSIGMLYAWRGSGKTYTALSLAIEIARGGSWMHYEVPQARPVLYIDGEMPLGDLQERVRHLTEGKPPPNLLILASEDLAANHLTLNLAKEDDREALLCLIVMLIKKVVSENFGLIILDNWTSLIRGIDENDNSKLDPIKEWLVSLRHADQSILIVHHEGKGRSGQRGASAREDILDYSIKLTEVTKKDEKNCSKFSFKWDKCRSQMPRPHEFTEVLEKVDGHLRLWLGRNESMQRHNENTKKVLKCLPARFGEIEKATGLNPKSINSVLKKQEAEGKVHKDEDGVWDRKGK